MPWRPLLGSRAPLPGRTVRKTVAPRWAAGWSRGARSSRNAACFSYTHEPVREDAAVKVVPELALDVPRHAMAVHRALPGLGEEALEVRAHHRVQHRRGRRPPLVGGPLEHAARRTHTAGRGRARLISRRSAVLSGRSRPIPGQWPKSGRGRTRPAREGAGVSLTGRQLAQVIRSAPRRARGARASRERMGGGCRRVLRPERSTVIRARRNA